MLSWREEKTVLNGAFYIFLFYVRQREEEFFCIKRKSNGCRTILKRKKDQAEHVHHLSEHCDNVMCIVSIFNIIIKFLKRFYCPFR